MLTTCGERSAWDVVWCWGCMEVAAYKRGREGREKGGKKAVAGLYREANCFVDFENEKVYFL